ncbi:MAG: glycosyltransferase family 2 protein [Ideonella sp.]|nr:glycosyltransferase family 2 protein [Ideonella sp.]
MPSPQDSAVNLSVVLITRNESRHVLACLQSVAFADEWIVVDAASSDDTREIAEAFGARVVRTDDWPGFGPQKNRALALARGRWVLSIDADERIGPALAAEIRAAVAPDKAGGAAGYELERLSSFCGQWMRHGDWYPDRVLRLFRRDAGRFTDDLVHESVRVDGPVARLRGDLLHETMTDLDDALAKLNRYSAGRAHDMQRQGKAGSVAGALGHAAWTFARGYLFKRGFLDGRLGLVLALYAAEGTYYRYLKLWLLAREPAALAGK